MLKEIFEECPLGSVIVRSCRLFIHSLMATNSVESNKKKLSELLNHMINRKMISPVESDKYFSQLSDFMHEDVSTNRDEFKSFSKENDRHDTFFFSTVNIGNYKELSMILKAILALSHGNASMERGFSINKNPLDLNMSQESILLNV